MPTDGHAQIVGDRAAETVYEIRSAVLINHTALLVPTSDYANDADLELFTFHTVFACNITPKREDSAAGTEDVI
ncbi:MAG TPA: hypothetical protein VMR02_03515 [Terracidiphilus sp.]|nr:hypothetical protein [Terracidiphilus sp.]